MLKNLPASGLKSHQHHPGHFHSSNLLTKHSGFQSCAFPQESCSHVFKALLTYKGKNFSHLCGLAVIKEKTL